MLYEKNNNNNKNTLGRGVYNIIGAPVPCELYSRKKRIALHVSWRPPPPLAVLPGGDVNSRAIVFEPSSWSRSKKSPSTPRLGRCVKTGNEP